MSRPALTDTGAKAIRHRLPTVSASAALKKASAAGNCISTGSKQIDGLLAGGLARGKLAEVHGPPGSGKTSVAISASAHALTNDGAVAWIDCGYQFPFSRLEQALKLPGNNENASSAWDGSQTTAKTDRFHHYKSPALAYLLALLLHPPANFPPPGTRLLVIDSISTLFASAFPTNYYPPSKPGRETPQQWAASRRWTLQRDVVSMLNKLAAVHDMAVLVTCQMSTRFDREVMGSARPKAMLGPSLNTKSWTDGLWARILLFRHWGPSGQPLLNSTGETSSTFEATKSINRYAGLVKLGGVAFEICGRFVPFLIIEGAIMDVQPQPNLQNQAAPRIPPTDNAAAIPAKRHAAEIADSESEGEFDDLTAALEEDEIQEVNEMGLTHDEQVLLDLELENSAAISP